MSLVSFDEDVRGRKATDSTSSKLLSFHYTFETSQQSLRHEVSTSDASLFGDGNEDAETVSVRKERHKWNPTEDGVLISVWLNTSKDPVVANEQKAIAFWKRIAAYYAASPKVADLQERGSTQCKGRWVKINEAVCKFVSSYEAATKQRSSGQNENDVLKLAHKIFYNDYKVKFTMEHAWLELHHDQKWSGVNSTKDNVYSKRRKLNDQSSTSVPVSYGEDEARPIGVKAAKGKGKKTWRKQATLEEEMKERVEFENMWEIRKKDFTLKQILNNQKLLDSLLSRNDQLTEPEIALKNKLINDLLTT
ncbi:PREDICTED: glutathione S-transferase T3-like [Brassica oleracea var. oleracea]|nr:PREDICTED: glutathione S-transferase T3-like [Brassica oleracea var. oleracea]